MAQTDLVDGLDLTVGLFRVKSSFLFALQKLIYFDKIIFRCSQINGGPVYAFTNQLGLDSVSYRQPKYFTGRNSFFIAMYLFPGKLIANHLVTLTVISLI